MKEPELPSETKQAEIGADTNIIIPKDRLYELIKLLKEIKKIMPNDTLDEYKAKYDNIKTFMMLNKLLKENGIEGWLKNTKEHKQSLELKWKMKEDEGRDNKDM